MLLNIKLLQKKSKKWTKQKNKNGNNKYHRLNSNLNDIPYICTIVEVVRSLSN